MRSHIALGFRIFPLLAVALLSLGVATQVGCSSGKDDAASAGADISNGNGRDPYGNVYGDDDDDNAYSDYGDSSDDGYADDGYYGYP